MAWRLGIACVAVSAWDGGDGGVCPGGGREAKCRLADPQVSGPEPTQTAVTVQTPIACNATRRTASCLAAGSVRVDRPGRWNHLTIAPAITAAASTDLTAAISSAGRSAHALAAHSTRRCLSGAHGVCPLPVHNEKAAHASPCNPLLTASRVSSGHAFCAQLPAFAIYRRCGAPSTGAHAVCE